MSHISRVFINGNSQAVRIPQELRLASKRVQISRTDSGDLLIHPLPELRGNAILQALTGFDAEFISALEADNHQADPVQESEGF